MTCVAVVVLLLGTGMTDMVVEVRLVKRTLVALLRALGIAVFADLALSIDIVLALGAFVAGFAVEELEFRAFVALAVVVVRSDFRALVALTVILELILATFVASSVAIPVVFSSSALLANAVDLVVCLAFCTFVTAAFVEVGRILRARVTLLVGILVGSGLRAGMALLVLHPFVRLVFWALVALIVVEERLFLWTFVAFSIVKVFLILFALIAGI